VTISSTPVASELVLVMDNGTGASGKQLTKNRVVDHIKTTAANEDVFIIAQGFLALQDKTNLSVQRNDASELEEV